MTFINLRKRAPEPEPDDVVEDVEPDETTEDDAGQEQEPEGAPLGFLPAVYQGVHGWCTWCSARIGAGPTMVVHGLALYSAAHYNAWVTFGVTGAFALAVGLFTPREPLDRIAARLEGHGTTPPAEETPRGTDLDPLVKVMWELIGEAPGVHLKTLTTVLSEAAEKAGHRPPSKAEVEAALEARNIPLKSSVRDAAGKVNKGVHRADLTAWQEALRQADSTALSSPENPAPLQARSE